LTSDGVVFLVSNTLALTVQFFLMCDDVTVLQWRHHTGKNTV